MAVEFCLLGRFRILSPESIDLTPKGSKSKALLVLLCMSDGFERDRRWIQNMLWSDRAPEQASGSLRQSLAEIRRSFGTFRDALKADHNYISLDPAHIAIDIFSEPDTILSSVSNGKQLLEGLDGKDAKFSEWLELQRFQFSNRFDGLSEGLNGSYNSSNWSIDQKLNLDVGSKSSDLKKLVTAAIFDQVIKNVSEISDVEIVSQNIVKASCPDSFTDLVLKCETAEIGNIVQTVVSLQSFQDGKVLWSTREKFGLASSSLFSNPDFLRISHDAALAVTINAGIGITKSNSRIRAEKIFHHALQELFSFDASKIRVADACLAQAHDLYPMAQFLAWRAMLRTIILIERTEPNCEALQAEAEEFARKAFEFAPGNSLVLSVISMAKLMLTEDPNEAYSHAKKAMEINPGNPMANIAVSSSLMRAGKLKSALEYTKKARKIARFSPYRHWWDVNCCLVNIANENFDDAIEDAEMALASSQNFRPPLRHLYALYNFKNDEKNAQRIRNQIHKVEPDFSLRRVIEDEHYPAITLKRSRLLEHRDILA